MSDFLIPLIPSLSSLCLVNAVPNATTAFLTSLSEVESDNKSLTCLCVSLVLTFFSSSVQQ